MSKKTKKHPAPSVLATAETTAAARPFDYEEMLTELEAIVADAEVRLAEEEAAA